MAVSTPSSKITIYKVTERNMIVLKPRFRATPGEYIMSVMPQWNSSESLRPVEWAVPQLHLIDTENPQPNQVEDFYIRQNPEEAIRTLRAQTKIGRVAIDITVMQPDELTDPTPFLIVKGFLASPGAYHAFGKALAANGRNVVIYGTNRHECLLRNPLVQQAKVAWTAMKAAHVMADFEVDEYDVIGHSMGTPAGAKLAAMQSRHVRSLVTTGGAGMHGPDPFWNMAYKLGKTGAIEAAPNLRRLIANTPANLALEQAGHVLRNVPLLAREGISTALIDSTADLETCKESGVLIDAFLFEDDTFFRPQDVLKHSGHLFDQHEVVPGALHLHPNLYPVEHAPQQVRASYRLNNPASVAA